MTSLCVFCGSSVGARPEYVRAAEALGAELGRRQVTLVYGGARVGLMGSIADATLEAGGRVIGVMPRNLMDREIAHQALTELRIVASMHERKALMIDLSASFVLLPGGFGSWDEFCEAVTWRQLAIHDKPLGLLNVLGYYDAFLSMMETSVAEGFVRAPLVDTIAVEDDPARLLDRMGVTPHLR